MTPDSHASRAAPTTAPLRCRWYLASLNDGLFIIDRPPSPAGSDAPPGIVPDSPNVVLNVTGLPQVRAQQLVDEHNRELEPLLASAAEADRLQRLINAPEVDDFMRGTHIEAIHQGGRVPAASVVKLNKAWESGFIEACKWFDGVTQDVDSPAAHKSRDAQVAAIAASSQEGSS